MIIRTGGLPSTLTTHTQQSQPNDTNTKKQDSTTNISSAANVVENANGIDNTKKVEDIKKQIDDGTYKVDVEKSADKMAQDLLLK
ncbi:flagellar biosynthesis anti-sigma factor FlgM [Helicobacter sp. 16-1353]|uniref:flagellar biosynthesis anti-sigma factor FlgM n=1 Tax=Helicobacter sp. 16-1353 TaxID=2004996 RepID=UPI000DCB154A|nr:flagellar biosynthesis anti-sigma factor FlgM [Helicobacter sp. 16-1353]RAX54372.1 flagellar biosynthesis anti-sigma factor FlgM [Helicobacter sp. 16-1353]